MRISDWSSDVCSSDLIEDCFRGAAELYAERRNHQRPVDEDREFHHRIDPGLVAKTFIAKPEVGVWRALLPQQRTRRSARARDQFDQQRPARRCLQIFDDMRLAPGVAEPGHCIARWHVPRVWVHTTVGSFALRHTKV